MNVTLCFIFSSQQAGGPTAPTLTGEEARLDMNEPPWDDAEGWTHASKRSEALLMFAKEYLLRGKCLFHLPYIHLLDGPEDLGFCGKHNTQRPTQQDEHIFFPCYFFSFLAVLDTKPRASHELENFSVTELHLKPLRNKGFCLWIHALVFNGAVPQFPIFVRSVGTFITPTSVCKCLWMLASWKHAWSRVEHAPVWKSVIACEGTCAWVCGCIRMYADLRQRKRRNNIYEAPGTCVSDPRLLPKLLHLVSMTAD